MEKELSRDKVHEELFEMLCAFADYCDKNNLRYYLVGGTLLGAVRHKGFIPWDDDIDVGMPRSDYEKLLKLSRENPIRDDFVVKSDIDGELSLHFAELLNTSIRLERPTSEFIGEDYQILNLFLDILPQDGMPSSEKETEKFLRKMKLLRYMATSSRAKFFHGSTFIRATLKLPAVLLGHAVGTKRWLNIIKKEAKKYDYDACEYVGCSVNGLYGMGERCLKKEVEEYKEVEFMGRMFKAPGCYDSYLRGIYGDYMTLPPGNKRVSHGLKAYKI